MSEITQLVEDTKNSKILLSELLLKAKSLAHREKNHELSAWIDNEVKGYSDLKAVPNYRIVPCIVRAHLIYGWTKKKVILPPNTDNQEVNEKLKHFDVLIGVSALEEFSNVKESIVQPLPPSVLPILGDLVTEGVEIEAAYREVNKAEIKQVLTNIRHHLLEKLLNLIPQAETEEEAQIQKIENTSQVEVFISHSAKDKSLVDKFVDHVLILGLRIQREKIFCTSIHGLNVKTGEDFKKTIYQKLKSAKIVFQIITENYKSSEVCLNEMGAAWVLSPVVIPIVANPFNYDVGFIHHNNQQIKLNCVEDLQQLYDDYKGDIFAHKISMVELNKQLRIFVDFVEKYATSNPQNGELAFFYNEESIIKGVLRSGIFGHPPMVDEHKFEEHDSFHKYYFVELNPPIDVLNNEPAFLRGNSFDTNYFNVTRIQLFRTDKVKIDLKKLLGKRVEVKGRFMGGHTAWHRTEVLLEYTDISLLN